MATVGENRSCQEHKPKYDGAKPNCATCKRWDPNEEKCREEVWVGAWLSEPEDNREIERLMRHDGFTRKNGSIRQIRRGS